MIKIKTADDIRGMRVAGGIAARILRELADSIVPGTTTTGDLDRLAERLLKENGAQASFKGFRGYPKAICVAVNEEVVHGIPGKRVLNEGDVIGLDIGASFNGYHGDTATTVPVGEAMERVLRFLRISEDCLTKGIEQAVPGNRLGDIGHAIQEYAEGHGYSIVRDLVGHGIGVGLHEEPQVPNYGSAGEGIVLREGMTLAVEPMINMGGLEVRVLPDGWTYVTKDGRISAHFEHTVAVTADGSEILTLLPEEAP